MGLVAALTIELGFSMAACGVSFGMTSSARHGGGASGLDLGIRMYLVAADARPASTRQGRVIGVLLLVAVLTGARCAAHHVVLVVTGLTLLMCWDLIGDERRLCFVTVRAARAG